MRWDRKLGHHARWGDTRDRIADQLGDPHISIRPGFYIDRHASDSRRGAGYCVQREGRYFAIRVDPADRPGCFAGKPMPLYWAKIAVENTSISAGKMNRDIFIYFFFYEFYFGISEHGNREFEPSGPASV
jgi:hypothetical protein